MTVRDFYYWLQGMFEVHKVTTLNEEQIELRMTESAASPNRMCM